MLLLFLRSSMKMAAMSPIESAVYHLGKSWEISQDQMARNDALSTLPDRLSVLSGGISGLEVINAQLSSDNTGRLLSSISNTGNLSSTKTERLVTAIGLL